MRAQHLRSFQDGIASTTMHKSSHLRNLARVHDNSDGTDDDDVDVSRLDLGRNVALAHNGNPSDISLFGSYNDRDSLTKNNVGMEIIPRVFKKESTPIFRNRRQTKRDLSIFALETSISFSNGDHVASSSPQVEGSLSPTISPTAASTTIVYAAPPGTVVMDKNVHAAVVAILVLLVTILFLVLLHLMTPQIRSMVRRLVSMDKRKIRRRYKAVDCWLITKEVVDHSPENCCHRTAQSTTECKEGQSSSSETLTSSISHEPSDNDAYDHDDASEDIPECGICMETLVLKSLVSWSPLRNSCRHVYHHSCIREWLVRHKECPTCRQNMLPIDNPALWENKSIPSHIVRPLWADRKLRYQETQCCVLHGLMDNKPDEDCSGARCKTSCGTKLHPTKTTLMDDSASESDSAHPVHSGGETLLGANKALEGGNYADELLRCDFGKFEADEGEVTIELPLADDDSVVASESNAPPTTNDGDVNFDSQVNN